MLSTALRSYTTTTDQLCHTTDPDMVNPGLALQLRGERLRVQVILLQQQCNIIPNLSTYNGYAGLQIGHRTHSRGRGYGETSTYLYPLSTTLLCKCQHKHPTISWHTWMFYQCCYVYICLASIKILCIRPALLL